MEKLIHPNPSLQTYRAQAIAKAYKSGQDLGVRETPLDYPDLPETCPYTLEKVLDSQFPCPQRQTSASSKGRLYWQ
ncbi:tsr2121 [Thermosynechococcus vestitus BP-1]|uniref:Tsr2121 protein n=1 Tax=Thermosynechococcus vestitus (strain NIES-2133 / IAM M-273 / BP-1) TaxID=197221 RepID=Q8DH39_THEVB|nr:tsr2121 [Thermosynechococcus vestitus BP-1]